MSSRDRFYHIGFLPDGEVSFDGARGNSKFATDTHRIGSGELRGEAREHLLGLRGSGDRLRVIVAHQSAIEVHGLLHAPVGDEEHGVDVVIIDRDGRLGQCLHPRAALLVP